MARAKNGLFDELLEAFEFVFTHIHPLWSLPVAGLLYFGGEAWFGHSPQLKEFRPLGTLLAAMAACTALGGGVAGWRQRRRRADFLRKKLDIEWLNSLSWEDFERQVGDYYRHRGFKVEHSGRNGPDGGVDLRLTRDRSVTLVQCKAVEDLQSGSEARSGALRSNGG